MTRKKPNVTDGRRHEHSPHRVHIPRFGTDGEVGLGDVVKRVTHAFGVKACGACERRAAALNRWLRFSGGAR
jgi:hypothetical protein